ncbi:PobR regulator [Xanthomonas bromi]|uniref:AraC family transcriptional regulator n=1 Tax=Xanthomonas bromi TaxID=56449 RepID=A0A1C3NQW7_9XANT|nr:helix-turn-helix domain-containing protein [Xanthomonas bromi]PPV05326.1 AraC family transcriptional regulator [Xanthomonas bromi]SBV52724.1 PobR regulator [Xanthomonas bromi]
MATPAPDTAAVPAFGLYGEQHADAAELLHWESIAARSRLHDWQIVPHRHEDLAQLVYVQRGPATLQLDGRTQRLRGASVAWLPPLCVHGFAFDPAVRGHVITMCMPLIRTALNAAPLLHQVLTTPAVVQVQHARRWLDVMFGGIAEDHARRRIGHDIAAQAAAVQLVIWMARTALERAQDAAAISPQADPALRHLRAYQGLIDQHYRTHWPISRYADQLGLTPGHLNAVCQRLAGASALQLLHRRIMLEARRTLRYTSQSVQQIAASLGFFDAAYFSRYFARHAGCSPTRFRAGS